MTLTQDDLQAIGQVVQTTVQPMIDAAVDSLAQSTAAGFAEVHERIDHVETRLDGVETRLNSVESGLNAKIDAVQQTVDKIERIQRAEVERDDRQDARLKHIQKVLHTV